MTTPVLEFQLSNELANQIARRFIARSDVKAIQHSSGAYTPHTANDKRLPWTRNDLIEHVEGKRTFGHYLLNLDDQCKLFAFDIDLEQKGWLPTVALPEAPSNSEVEEWLASFAEGNPRAAWTDRKSPARPFMKRQLKEIAHKLMKVIFEDLELPCAAAYSGGKGVHVYAFTGLVSAHEAREGAQIVLDSIGEFSPKRGEHFYSHNNTDPVDGYPNISIEVFPKQTSLEGKDLGNLMRIPLGRNLKNPKDPTFFMDMSAPLAVMRPVDPMWALGDGSANPWRAQGE